MLKLTTKRTYLVGNHDCVLMGANRDNVINAMTESMEPKIKDF